MGSLVGVDLNTTLAQRQERRAQSSPKGSISQRSKSSASQSYRANPRGPSSSRGPATDRSTDKAPRAAPRYDPSFQDARAGMESAVASGSATTPEAAPARPRSSTPQSSARLYSPTKSQQSRLALKAANSAQSPTRSASPTRRPRSAAMPSAGKLPGPGQFAGTSSRPRLSEGSRLMDETMSTSLGKSTPSQALAVTDTGMLAAGALQEGAAKGRHFALTASPTGKYAANAFERAQLRSLDPYSNIDYIAGSAPDNDRNMKEASWLASQAFVESLRSYPVSPVKSPPRAKQSPSKTIVMHDDAGSGATLFSRYTFSGNTYPVTAPAQEHIETAVRRRCGIATSDAEWRAAQLPRVWTSTRTLTKHDWGPFELVPSYRSPNHPTSGQM
mmetsp:Transcript_2967/g.7862  ORF Transcript_2967/g.7862 Transcript_2967/m.7862 type:complete len:387 (+) Transcript_2967:66-1226(+)